MQKWKLENRQQLRRRVGKTLEECGELTNVLGRILIQGLDEIDPGTGKTNRCRLLDEIADVYCQLDCLIEQLPFTEKELAIVSDRIARKHSQMVEWESHYSAEEKV